MNGGDGGMNFCIRFEQRIVISSRRDVLHLWPWSRNDRGHKSLFSSNGLPKLVVYRALFSKILFLKHVSKIKKMSVSDSYRGFYPHSLLYTGL